MGFLASTGSFQAKPGAEFGGRGEAAGSVRLGKEPEGSCLLSSLLSMRSWVWLAEVRAEKVRKWLIYSSGRFLRSLLEMVSVFPVPVGPMHSTWENSDREGGAHTGPMQRGPPLVGVED